MELYYQPKIDARSQQVTAAEALLRWKHPRRGMVSPAVFIPLAERHGLIVALGQWVIDEACRQAGQWRRAACACAWPSTSRATSCARTTWWTGSRPRCSAMAYRRRG
jgi:EAL domain-containing protein (putative c-di-GMP-specific phosphodiesterase class I)